MQWISFTKQTIYNMLSSRREGKKESLFPTNPLACVYFAAKGLLTPRFFSYLALALLPIRKKWFQPLLGPFTNHVDHFVFLTSWKVFLQRVIINSTVECGILEAPDISFG